MKQDTTILVQIIDLLLEKSFPFVVYQHPDTGKFCVIAQNRKAHMVHNIADICNLSGFVIAPFEPAKKGLTYFIKNEMSACKNTEFDILLKKLKTLTPFNKEANYVDTYNMTKEEYIDKTDFLIQKLKNKTLDKVVFSRVKTVKKEPGFNISGFFIQLAKKYPKAFTYLFSIPDTGTWIGATPEILLSRKKNGDTLIMALAGTAPVENDKQVNWGEKEKVEQRYVSEFIRAKLSELNYGNFTEESPKTVTAGSIAHIQTIFKIHNKDAQKHVADLVNALHPTPAVCGLPQSDALELIKNIEPHDRKFYTGYLGPWLLNGQSDLFVNLRCAEISPAHINLFVGGGLTADSVPEKEWKETELKAQTLLSVLQKNSNN